MIKNIIAGLLLCASIPFYGFTIPAPTNVNQPTDPQETAEQPSSKEKEFASLQAQLQELQKEQKSILQENAEKTSSKEKKLAS